MKDLLHVVQIHHTLHDVVSDRHLLTLSKLLLLFVKLVEETTIFEVFSDESILVGSDANTHVEDNVRMLEVADDIQLLHKILLVLVLACFNIILNGYLLPYIFALVNLTKPTLSNQLDVLNVFLLDNEGKTPVLFQEIVKLPNLRRLQREVRSLYSLLPLQSPLNKLVLLT